MNATSRDKYSKDTTSKFNIEKIKSLVDKMADESEQLTSQNSERSWGKNTLNA